MNSELIITGARVHNLKNVTLRIPRNKLVVFTGLSGSGKSSLAFDTIYAEGQRRYVESLSAYARQFLEKLDKPDVDRIEGLSPAISIDQKSASYNPRSTVGTVTEIYDYMRLLFASIGQAHCPNCGRPIQKQSIQEIANTIMGWPEGQMLTILSPVVSRQKGEFRGTFDAILRGGFRRVRIDGTVYRTDELPTLDKNKWHSIEIVVDRIPLSTENRTRIFESIETAVRHAEGKALVETDATPPKSQLFSEHYACPVCEISLEEISPRLFSFNSPYGACKRCNGLGDTLEFDLDIVMSDPVAPLDIATQKCVNLSGTTYGRLAEKTAREYGFSLENSFDSLTADQKNVFLYGDPAGPPSDWKAAIAAGYSNRHWEGLMVNLKRRYLHTDSEGMRFFFRGFMSAVPCEACHGARLNPAALSVKIEGQSISEVTSLSITRTQTFLETLQLSDKQLTIVRQVLKEIRERLQFMIDVGLDYLTLHRKANSLSGGEFQRIRLATQIGSGLTGVLYVLDEPSIGLHQRDNQRLIQTLVNLRNLGNTLIVVEHDEDMICSADHVVDIGPGAGKHGGEILFSGTVAQLKKDKNSLTAQYLNGHRFVVIPKKRRPYDLKKALWVRGATENNLKSVDAGFPLGCMVVVTGVSGSGKSTLIQDILQNALMRHFFQSKVSVGKHKHIEGLDLIDKVITIDQSPIGRTPRSNPATYVQLFTPIRELFAQTREAKVRGFSAGRFSFNVRGGRCEACEGDGVNKIEMHFLSDVYVTCEVCKGKRYNDQTLAVTYKGHSISDVLNMTVAEALDVFDPVPAIQSKLKTLVEVGLGYIHLGQNATTLSGGEAQRVKLAKELSKRSTGKTLYLLDEPTTGLHFEDVRHLLTVLNRLVDTGNTVVVIEHNLDVIKTADYIVDLGPQGGEKGGQIVATGTPEEIAKNPASATGEFLKPILNRKKA